jgi:virulence-associated protein VagC
MSNEVHAKVFWSGGSQAVRLPKQMRLEGVEVLVRRRGKTLVLTPIEEPAGWGDFWERLHPLKQPVKRHPTRTHEKRRPL